MLWEFKKILDLEKSIKDHEFTLKHLGDYYIDILEENENLNQRAKGKKLIGICADCKFGEYSKEEGGTICCNNEKCGPGFGKNWPLDYGCINWDDKIPEKKPEKKYINKEDEDKEIITTK